MTVSYQYEVASSTSGGFTKLLFMWRGSLYKLIYRELFMFLFAFGLLSAIYRNILSVEQRRIFERIALYCDAIINQIPLSFVLGFYVAYIATRWWNQFLAIPWPDKIMHSLALYVGGDDEQSRILRRTLIRYLNLSLVLILRSISSAVKRRFPTLDHLVEAGFMTPVELEMYAAVPSLEFNTYWIPCAWFVSQIKEAKKNKYITDAQGLKFVMEEFADFRQKCGLLWSYDWISIPLVYTQVVTIATYTYFIIAVIGRQYIDSMPQKNDQIEIDIYVPVFTVLQFLFYMGLLKVAEQLINPFGDDDEDFELNWLIDRHTKVSYLGVDSLTLKCPPLVRDKYFNDADLTLPYTGAAFAYKKKTYRGSVHNMQVPEAQQTMFLPEITEEEEEPQRTPKHSLTNVITGSPSPSAGIWRQSFCSTDGDRMSTAEEGVSISVASTPEIKPRNKMMKFLYPKRDAQPTAELGSKDGGFSSSEMKQWASNSTIDSYCSTAGPTASAMDLQDARKGSTNSIKSLRRLSGSVSSLNKNFRRLSGSVNSIKSQRRGSGVAGAWKVVRWKPVLDSGGDVWSDNKEMRHVVSSVALSTTGPSTIDEIPELPPRRNTSPAGAHLIPPSVLIATPGLYNALDKSTALSMPNLCLKPTDEKASTPEPDVDKQPKSL